MEKDHEANAMNHGSAERTVRICHTADYEKWFRAEVALALQEADNPATLWLDNATVMAESARKRADWGSAKAVNDSATRHHERSARWVPTK